MKFIIDLLFGILFSMSLGGLGVVFFRRILKTEIDFFRGFFTGCGIAVVVLFVGGLLGLFGRTFFFIFIILIFIFAIPGRRKFFTYKFIVNRKYILPLILLALVLVITGLSSLSPPIKNDTLYYHLGLPKLWSIDGYFNFYPTIVFSATALNSELLLTPILSVVSPEAAQFFVFLVGLMVIFLLGDGFSRFTGGSKALAVLSLSVVPLFISGMADAKNDYLAAGFSLMSALFYFDYLKRYNPGFILLAGIFAGLAAGTKTNALIFVMAMFIVIVLSRHRLKDIILFLVGTLVFGFPWYLKAYIETGNPFFPFYDNIFHSPYWREIFDGFNRVTLPEVEHKSILNFITSPFRLVYFPDVFRGRLGPLLFMLLPLLLFIRKIPGVVFKALFISAAFYILWYLVSANARYMMPIVPLLALLAAYVMDRFISISRSSGLVIICTLTLLLAVNGVQVFRDGFSRAKAAVGIIEYDEFLHKIEVLDPNDVSSSTRCLAIPYYDIWQFINVTAEDDAVVGILCSNWNRADGFYLDRHFLLLNPTEQVEVDFSGRRYNLISSLVKHKVNYVLIDNLVVEEFSAGSTFTEAPGFKIFKQGVTDFVDIVKENGQLVYLTDRFELYKLSMENVILKATSS
ncbi:MAG: hypothetical protein B6D58_02350 [candidate division Zixibacteria bacterium 4484_95]|nr:MAG: hypothetical protein B6D58_02350 [candidate division Zixibacteria bacterium 4484_95]